MSVLHTDIFIDDNHIQRHCLRSSNVKIFPVLRKLNKLSIKFCFQVTLPPCSQEIICEKVSPHKHLFVFTSMGTISRRVPFPLEAFDPF